LIILKYKNLIYNFFFKIIYKRQNFLYINNFKKEQANIISKNNKRREFLRKSLFGLGGVAIGGISSIAHADKYSDNILKDPVRLDGTWIKEELLGKAKKDFSNVSILPEHIRKQLLGDQGIKGDRGPIGFKGDKGEVGAKFIMSGTTLNIIT
jgi:hypothetical protein